MGLRTWVKEWLFGKPKLMVTLTTEPPKKPSAPVVLSKPIGPTLVKPLGESISQIFTLPTRSLLFVKVFSDDQISNSANDENAERYIKSGLAKAEEENDLGAIQDWEKAIEYKPESYKTWCYLGVAQQKIGFKEKALISYEKAIQYQQNRPVAWYNRGNLLREMGEFEKAIASYDKAIESKPDHHKAWNNRGVALFELGRYEKALVSFEKAIGYKGDDNHDAWLSRGKVFFKLGQYEEAISSCEKAIQYQPDFYEAWENRGRASSVPVSQPSFINTTFLSPSSIRSSSITIQLRKYPANLHIQYSELVQRGYKGQIANLTVGLMHCPADTHPLGHGYLQRSLGDTHRNHAKLHQSPRPYWRQALTAYKASLAVLTEDYPEERLLTLQALVRTCLALDAIPAARQYQTQGSLLYETLRTQAQNKRAFETKFRTFRLTEIDLLIGRNEPRRALQQAEFYKNCALTWLFDNEQEITHSPTYDQIRSHLTPGNAIVYWHQSTDRITTFILTNDNPEPIVLDCDRQQQHKRFTKWKEDWDKDYGDYRSKKSATQSDHPWRQQMRDRVKQLAEILEIDTIERHLKNTETLILIPHRDLHRYPIHALFDRPTTHAPSLQSVVRASHPAPSSDRPSLLLINDPDRSSRRPDHRPMPFAQIESAIIQQLINSNATHINHTNATHNTIIQQLTQQNHRYFHFIGHAEHDFQKPENSALDLCDRPLTAKTIANLNLHHLHLATLSSCETSIVSTENHAEYLGLTSAFLCAGTHNILSTLWQVEEIASAWFMIHFHQLIKAGLSPAIALHHTQTWMQTVTWREFTHWLEELRQLPGLPSFPIDRLESRIQNILNKGDTIDLNQPTEYCNPIHWAAFILTGQG